MHPCAQRQKQAMTWSTGRGDVIKTPFPEQRQFTLHIHSITVHPGHKTKQGPERTQMPALNTVDSAVSAPHLPPGPALSERICLDVRGGCVHAPSLSTSLTTCGLWQRPSSTERAWTSHHTAATERCMLFTFTAHHPQGTQVPAPEEHQKQRVLLNPVLAAPLTHTLRMN